MTKAIAKKFFSYAKYPIALVILYFVLQAADVERIWEHMKQTPPWALIGSFVAFTIAQYFAVIRMNAYYADRGRPLNLAYSFKLHYVGLFYNIVLPGGIGGYGYKVFLLKRKAGYPAKEGILIQLLTRTNGLLILMISLVALLPFLPIPLPTPLMAGVSVVLIAAGIAIYFWLIPRLLKGNRAMEWRALPYSCGVQGFNLLSMVLLWAGLSDGQHLADYMFLFQAAAIAGMIPVTIGGLGIREFTFFYGADWINRLGDTALDPEMGIVISLLVFAVTAASALIGLIWIGRIGKMMPCAAAEDMIKP
jgi:uncharacterized membrane protein YbhN (UPF0104 family)